MPPALTPPDCFQAGEADQPVCQDQQRERLTLLDPCQEAVGYMTYPEMDSGVGRLVMEAYLEPAARVQQVLLGARCRLDHVHRLLERLRRTCPVNLVVGVFKAVARLASQPDYHLEVPGSSGDVGGEIVEWQAVHLSRR